MSGLPSRDSEGNYVIPVRDGYRVIFWYDRKSRNWVVQKMSPEDYQIGDATYVYAKHEAHNAATIFANHTVSWIPPNKELPV